jgi:urea transport system permease protein
MTAAVAGAKSRVPGAARFAVVVVVLALLVFLVLPAAMSPFRLGLLAKYLCYAIVGVGIALAWGRGGMLTLGQGVFFGIGGYAMGMYLKLADVGPGHVPDFMSWSGVETLPALWKPFANAGFALVAAVVLPMLLATFIGVLVFRQRVRGAYFAILSQALAAAFVILLVGQQGMTGGTNGLTNFRTLFGHDLGAERTQRSLFFAAAIVLGVVYLLARHLAASRFGRLLVAVRDAEDRVRFLGYNPTTVKTVTFAVSAGMAGLAGALFVPIVGIISPALLGVVPSIELIIGVAVGGRASILGAAIGSVLVAYAKTTFSEKFPSGWLYLQGAMFVLVMMFAPKGIAGLLSSWRSGGLSWLPSRIRPAAPDPRGSDGGAGDAPASTVPATGPASTVPASTDSVEGVAR